MHIITKKRRNLRWKGKTNPLLVAMSFMTTQFRRLHSCLATRDFVRLLSNLKSAIAPPSDLGCVHLFLCSDLCVP